MATLGYIIDGEQSIIRARHDAKELLEAVQMETDFGKVYPENSDSWGTLAVNARLAAAMLMRLPETIDDKR